jgi:hypothetical protein
MKNGVPSKRLFPAVTAAALLSACSLALGVENAPALTGAARELLATYPGTRVHMEQGRVNMIYGAPMTAGVTPHDAATRFLTAHGGAFGCGNLELAEAWSTPVSDGRFTVFGYTQAIDGVPVEYGMARVLVKNGPIPQVVYAAGNLAPRREAGLGRAAITGEAARAFAQADPRSKGLVRWDPAQLVVFQGEGDWVSPVLAWRVAGSGAEAHTTNIRSFFVDAGTGRIMHIRGDVLHTDVSGTVRGMGSPGVDPDASYNPPAQLVMPNIRVGITGSNTAYTNVDGTFTITHSGTSPVVVNSGVGAASGFGGQWVNVIPVGGGALVASSASVAPPGPANILFNPAPSQTLTAQVNALIGTNLTHNLIKDRAPGFSAIDYAIPANTGLNQTCNAFFDQNGITINFYNAGGGCPNSAYSTVVSHEYGHFIVNRLTLAQNAFGEGYGDTVASMVWDDQAVGRGFFGQQGVALRDPIAANIQYPCSASCGGGIHCCGQQLSAVWWRIGVNMRAEFGSGPGFEMTRERFVAWSLITPGGPNSSNAIGPATAIQVLTIDDDDGNINNGTPNYSRICPAFAAGSVQCPPILPLAFEYPAGRPAFVNPGQPTEIAVNISGSAGGIPQAGSGTVTYRTNTFGSFTTVPMTEVEPNHYIATIAGAPCFNRVEYYVSGQTTTGASQSDPVNAPAAVYSALSGYATVVADLSFEEDPQWTVTNTALASGAWERATPHTPASQGCPAADYDGSGTCWVTDNRATAGTTTFDVNGGPTVLTSRAYDLASYPTALVSFARWFTSTGGTPDAMTFEFSTDDGATWSLLETYNNSTSGWSLRNFTFTNLSAHTRFRWSTSDNPNNSVTEAGIDAFKIIGVRCSPPPAACYANCDGSTAQPILNVLDFTCFLNRFSAGDSYANCDGSTAPPVLNVLDFSCFLNRFAAGCP